MTKTTKNVNILWINVSFIYSTVTVTDQTTALTSSHSGKLHSFVQFKNLEFVTFAGTSVY